MIHPCEFAIPDNLLSRCCFLRNKTSHPVPNFQIGTSRPNLNGAIRLSLMASNRASLNPICWRSLEDFIFVSQAGEKQRNFQNMIGKWKDLRHLKMAPLPWNLEEILREISSHCKHFMGLEMSGWIGWEQVSAIVNLLPQIKHLHLHLTPVPEWIFQLQIKHLLSILEGCKELEVLDVKDCWVEVDDKLLEMAAHIRRFECSGFIYS
ncbi:hypothetical protein H6P81_016362 [Aristolochia fimbriata]|uniref:Uncharacterized protein n=1 Tax=Aristolochia fimbriata TaxID=158543 RepID=A0AAV7EBA9_ARIFI|nr:hypothetical protein H6P81_016362 [Aristolochia fimbriata]